MPLPDTSISRGQTTGSSLLKMPAMSNTQGTIMGSQDASRAILRFLQRVSHADILRGAQTIQLAVQSYRRLFEEASKATPIGDCPLYLCGRVRRKNRARALAPLYILLDKSFPVPRYLARSYLAVRCYAYRDTHNEVSPVRGIVLPQIAGQERHNLASQQKTRDWCKRNSAPCIMFCRAKEKLPATHSSAPR